MSGYLCEELVDEVFTRLPSKSLLRFRSLSKSWCSRISSPDFILLHLQSSKKTQKVLIQHHINSRNNKDKDMYTLHSEDRLPLDPGLGYVGITGVRFSVEDHTNVIGGSCNGILCLVNYNESICLWNMSIRRKVAVPQLPSVRNMDEGMAYGFGFDPITDDYNIVGIRYIYCQAAAFLYSLKKGSWSKITSPVTTFFTVRWGVCFFNATLHWVVKDFSRNSPKNTYRDDFIMTFNISSHVFGKILLPTQSISILQLTIINDSLAVVCCDREHDYTLIWVMKEYNNVESWYLHFEFQMDRFQSVVKVLQPIPNGDLLLITKNDQGYQVYNPQTRLFTKVLKFRHHCWSLEMDTYAESLELLDRGTLCGKTIFPRTKKNSHKKARLLQY